MATQKLLRLWTEYSSVNVKQNLFHYIWRSWSIVYMLTFIVVYPLPIGKNVRMIKCVFPFFHSYPLHHREPNKCGERGWWECYLQLQCNWLPSTNHCVDEGWTGSGRRGWKGDLCFLSRGSYLLECVNNERINTGRFRAVSMQGQQWSPSKWPVKCGIPGYSV